MATITITLYVSESGIAQNAITQQNINDYCYFEAGTANSDFNTTADVGDTIIWQGQTNPASNYVIDITQVKKDNVPGNQNVLGGNNGTLQGNGLSPETVTGTVQANTYSEAEEYSVFFKVNGTGTNFQVDPKITVNPRQTA